MKAMSKRMKQLDKCEKQHGHKYVWEGGERMVDRSEGRVIDLECRYEVCGKLCKSKRVVV